MAYIPMTEYDTASPEVRREYDDQIAKHGRITNMKRTLLHNVPAFKTYMDWYTLYDLLRARFTDRELVLIRDSFGSSLAPLLAGSYRAVTLADLRYLQPEAAGRYLRFTDQDVLFLFSATLLNNSQGLR